MPTSLQFCDIKPFIRYAQRLSVSDCSNFSSLTAYDNRFFYCLTGKGHIIIDGKDYPMQKGTLILWGAGVPYDILVDKGEEMELLGCNFDYTQEHSFLAAPIPPAHDSFNEKDILERIFFSDAPCLSSVVYQKNMHLVESTAAEIFDEFTKHFSFFRESMSALFLKILCAIVREEIFSADSVNRKRQKVQEILAYISENYRLELTNRTLGEKFGYHPNYINYLVVQHTGMSLHKYLLGIRINRAIDLLQTTDIPVSTISAEVGFSDYNHFLKYFKQATGYTTKAFRAGK